MVVVSSSRVCIDCKATKTLWRTGPSGSKTLWNACGIRHRKKKRRHCELLKMKYKELHQDEEVTEVARLYMALSCSANALLISCGRRSKQSKN